MTPEETAAILRAAAQLELPLDTLGPAETAGLTRTAAGTIMFRHALVRSALLQYVSGVHEA